MADERVAIILNSFPKLSEKFLLNHIVGLVKAGYDVRVFASRRYEGQYHGIFHEHRIDLVTTWLDIPYSVKPRLLEAPRLFLSLFAKSPRSAIEALRFRKYRTAARNMKLLYFGNAFHGLSFDVIHCHFGPNGLIGAYLKECGYGKRIVTAFHGSDINSYPKRYGADVYRTLYEKCDLFTANTEYTKSKIVENGCDASLIHVVPECLIAAEYDGVDGQRRERNTVLTVGRLEEKKGHVYALRAIEKVRLEIPGVKYYIVGGGSLENQIRTEADRLGIADACVFAGSRTSEQVREYYAKCEVFTLPSVTASNGDKEGQGLVLQEAQICGMPVVSTRHNGIPDGILENETGYLVEERDVDALAEKIAVLLADEEKRRAFGARGKSFVTERYDIATVTASIARCYERALSSGAR